MNRTIAAVATPQGIGGIAVVRLSGPQSLAIADRVFEGKVRPSLAKSHTVHYGRFLDPETGEMVDEVLMTVFRAPHSYTTEDLVEISCHGGPVVAEAVLEALLSAGASPAEPGEFTRRAVMAGRIDLTQAEAVLELCRARTHQARRIALKGLKGEFSRGVRALSARILDLLSWVEAAIQFPEEGVEVTEPELERLSTALEEELLRLEERVLAGQRIFQGARVVICGEPNVGKSSLFNALLGEPRAIVDESPGTTRDWLEAEVRVDRMTLRLQDTAGFGLARIRVEAMAMARAKSAIEGADLVLLVLDNSRRFGAEGERLLSLVRKRPHLLVVNKVDLPGRLDLGELGEEVVKVSARFGIGLSELKSRLKALLFDGVDGLIYNERWVLGLRSARECVARARTTPYLEARAQELSTAHRHLAELTGESAAPELLDRIFAQFCIGK